LTQRNFLEQLDFVNNEDEVREHIAHGRYNSQHVAIAQEWLRRKEASRAVMAAARAEVREEEANSIARAAGLAAAAAAAAASEANAIARSAKKISIAAVLAAFVAAIATVASVKW
jgi:hypothetical protein